MFIVGLRDTILVMLLSILRKRAYRVITVVLIPILLLSTILCSSFNTTFLISNRLDDTSEYTTLLTLGEDIDKCYNLRVVGVTRIDGVVLPILEVPESLVNNSAFHFRKINDNCEFTSIPLNIYEKYNASAIIINSVEKCVSHVHRGLDSVLQFSREPFKGNIKLCIKSRLKIFEHVVNHIERDLVEKASLLLNLLLLAYVPLIYLAVARVQGVLSREFKVLLELGVNPRKLVLCFALSILILSFVITVALVSSTVVAVNSLHKFLALYWFVLLPYPKFDIILVIVEVQAMVFLVSFLVGCRRIAHV